MAIRLAVNYLNTAHRFVTTAQVTLTLNGTAENEAKDSKPGQRRWDITDTVGTNLELRVLIPEPAGSGLGKPLLDLKQVLQVIALAGGANSLTPKGTAACPDTFNPRLTGQLVAASSGRRFEINVDLTFLDVTDYYQARTHRLDEYTNMPQTNPPRQSGVATGLVPNTDPLPHYGTKLRILEFTGGKPVTWAVLIPPAVKPDSNRIGTVLFFRPAMTTYTNTDDLDIGKNDSHDCDPPAGALLRYLGDPLPEATPFFSQPKGGSCKSWKTFPCCGWEKQISNANKCALFVHPFPHGIDYGTIVLSKFPEILASLCKILWADGTIGASVCADLRLARIAVSGFSAGGDATFACLKSRPEKIDELYLFDPNGTGSNQTAIEAWFRRGGKKLRMFGGGFQQASMMTIAKDLASSDASVLPQSGTAWGDAIYHVAVHCAASDPKVTMFNAPTDTNLGVLSTLTNMFVASAEWSGALNMEGHLPSGTVVKGVISDCIPEEAGVAALSLVNDSRNTGKKLYDVKLIFPIATAADFNQNLQAISVLKKNIRHQWPVVGGSENSIDTNRGLTFAGYLYLAINGSGFS
jgi:hypothetical protein